jgi:FlgD Ig-like domain
MNFRGIALLAIPSIAFMAAPTSASTSFATPFSIHWTAPGDDIMTGRAQMYELRYSMFPFTAANFNQATKIAGLPAPGIAGTPQSFEISGLPDGVLFYFALKSADDRGNWSSISNVATRPAEIVEVHASPLALSFSLPVPNPARASVRWDYSVPQATRVQVDVFDVTGRHVHTVASGALSAGSGELSWDVRDHQGRPVGAGVYFVKARLGELESTNRLLIVR